VLFLWCGEVRCKAAEEQSGLWFIEACASKLPSVSSAPRSHRANKLRTGARVPFVARTALAAERLHETMACEIVWVGVLLSLMLSADTHAGLLPTREEAVEIFADIASEQAVSVHTKSVKN